MSSERCPYCMTTISKESMRTTVTQNAHSSPCQAPNPDGTRCNDGNHAWCNHFQIQASRPL